ncbi:MAG: hypothetical protein U5N56_03970 [Candidatus Marinimicrobia bacterium]|nr:hypothetical protein [Candidatus Neomarinimicrobiota bacterium]
MKIILILSSLFLLLSCQDEIMTTGNEEQMFFGDITERNESRRETLVQPLRMGFDDFPRVVPIPEVTAARAGIYNADAEGDYIAEYTQADMADTLSGYVTDNSAFFEAVLLPSLEPYLDSLNVLEKYQAVNVLTLFIHESFQDFFGLSYYRWGGDITDRDQPQPPGYTRSTKRYGMDCSGFAASPYEVAVLLGILDSTQYESAFSCFGFKHICETDPEISDGGGRGGSANNYRLEVSDMAKIGETVTTIPSGTTPTDTQMELMQAGDLVIKSGHSGILIEIYDELYFLESGGGTLREDGLYTPYRAKEALADFAVSRTTTIRRCLPEKETISGIRH